MADNVPGLELPYEAASSIYVHDLDIHVSSGGIYTHIHNTICINKI